MTDRTHPDSGRIITSGDVIAELHACIAELEAQLSSSGFTAADMATAEARGFRDGVASVAASAPAPSAHIKEPYTLAEIKAKIASNDYSAEMLLQHAMLLLDSASLAASAGSEPAAHVQKPAEIEHVAGDVSKNKTKSNMSTHPAPATQQEPWAWYVTGCDRLLDEDDAKAEARHIGGTARAVPLYTAPQPSPAAQADSQPALPEITAELRRLHTENERLASRLKAYEDLGGAADDVQLLRMGYAAARLEIESLQARIKTTAEERADEMMVAHLDGGMRAEQPTPQPTQAQAGAVPLTDEQIDAVAESMTGGLDGFLKGWGWRQFAREILKLRRMPDWEPQFDCMTPKQEELAVQFCQEIAGPRGKRGSPPDPVRLLEMAEALYKAEREHHHGIKGGQHG